MESEGFGVHTVGLPTETVSPAGVGETFLVDGFTGAAALQVPIVAAEARGFGPDLALVYNSHGGPSPYGLGFSLTLPHISRRTHNGVPRYDGTDVYLLGDQGALVPLDDEERTERVGSRTYTVTRYAPQLDEAFDVIERWRDETGESFWRTVDGENVTSLYGRTALSRISDAHDPRRVATWLLDVAFDARGNAMIVEYLAENTDNVPDAVFEVGREQTANRYPSRIRYGNTVPYVATSFGVGPQPPTDWLLDLVVDYGQYDVSPANPNPSVPVRTWPARRDPFSTYQAGFEVRTHRLCRNLLTFHNFPELGPQPVLTHALRLTHEETPSRSTLIRLQPIGYAPDRAPSAPDPYRTAELAPLGLRYGSFRPADQHFRPVLDERDRPVGGLGPPFSTWVDMRAQGVPGVLYTDGDSVLYRAPRAVEDGSVRLGPPLEVESFPVERAIAADHIRLIDLDGDARFELLVVGDGLTGVYRQAENGDWQPFTRLPEIPTELDSVGSAFADLSGTGRVDLVMITPDRIRVYPAEDGPAFGRPFDVENHAEVSPLVPASPGALVLFADVLGAGSDQLVRIEDGSVRCWPSLGHGAFAPVVTLADAPRLGADADLSRLFLADLDGSGAADLVYADGSRLRVWMNRSGNGFAEPIEIPVPIPVTSGGQVRFADVSAVGAQSVLVSDVLGTGTWSCAVVGQTQPYLLEEIDNNLGAVTRVGYRGSAAYRLEDERAGIPWLTYLPFPVPVVSRVEQIDEVSRARLVTDYRYRHGYYDVAARQFRGFGLVEHRDAEQFEATPSGTDVAASVVPPLLVKTWYHVGAWLDAERLEDAFRAEYYRGDPLAYVMPNSVECWNGAAPGDPEAYRQAVAALVGRRLRTERYGEDGSPDASVPYDVSEQNYDVVMRQAPATGRHGVYTVRDRETFDTAYERDPADPVMTHRATLEYDSFDNATRSVTVDYPRRSAARDVIPEQRVLRIRFGLDDFINAGGSEPHFVGLPYQERSFEAHGATAPSGYFDFAGLTRAVSTALNGEDGATASLFGWRRRYYQAADGTEAPLGSSGPQQLLRRDPRAFADEDWLRTLFAPVLDGTRLADVLVRQGRFASEPGTGRWWRPGVEQTYAPAQDFFAHVRSVDARGAATTYRYDAHRVAVVEATESGPGVRARRVLVDTFDYTTLLPTKVTDVNDDVSEVLLDPLARVVRTSRYGELNGVRVGFEPLAGRSWPEPTSLTDLVDNAPSLLGGAESLSYYDVRARSAASEPQPALEPQPATAARVTAREYPAPGNPPPVLTIEYMDGFGRVFERKTETEPSTPGGPRRWISSGRVRLTAAGSPYKSYRPYFSDTYLGKDDSDPGPTDVALVTTYDALDRVVRIDAPLGVHGTVTRTAWSEVDSDFCDTVRTSRYWAEHIVDGRPVGLDRFAGQALLKSGLAGDTPTTRAVDNRGRLIAHTVEQNTPATAAAFEALGMTAALAAALLVILRANGFLDFRHDPTILFQPEQPGFSLRLPAEYQPYDAAILRYLDGLRTQGTPLTSRFDYDVLGNQTLAVDPRLPLVGAGTAVNFRRAFALDGSLLRTVGADSGTTYIVPDCQGQPVLRIDGTGTLTRNAYDAFGRLSTVVVRRPNGPEQTVERWVYGDTDGAGPPPPTSANLNGRLWRSFDESGLVEYASYTLTGDAQSRSRRFLQPDAPVDWTVQNSTPTSPLLRTTAYPLTRRFDALGRVRAETSAGGERVETEYLLSGLVGAVRLVTAAGHTLPCVVSARYSALGQPVEISYGNGTVTQYGYDPDTVALTTIRTRRADGTGVLQDLTVYHDVMGNLTHQTDAAFGPMFGLPAGFDADSDADYDALYHLVSARGIERVGRDAAADREGGYAGLVVPWTPSGVDPANVDSYRRLFAYDTGGNLYAVVHESASNPWSTQVVVSDASNRAVEAAIFGAGPADPLVERVAPAEQVDEFFDRNGNQTRLLGIDAVDWAYRNQIERLDVATGRDRYGYDGHANRVRATAENGTVRREALEFGPLRLERVTSADGAQAKRRRLRVTSGSYLVAEYVTEDDDEAGRLVFTLGDPLGSTVLRLSDQGALLTYEAYIPYGGTALAIAPDEAGLADTLERYSAEPRDRSSGFYYYGARYLAPWTGRWSSPDPAGPVDGLNVYAFVRGNPTSAIDVGGLRAGRPHTNRRSSATRPGAPPPRPQGVQQSHRRRHPPRSGYHPRSRPRIKVIADTNVYDRSRRFNYVRNRQYRRVWLTEYKARGSQLVPLLRDALLRGRRVSILSGTHGDRHGNRTHRDADAGFLRDDQEAVRNVLAEPSFRHVRSDRVQVVDTSRLSDAEVGSILLGDTEVIVGFCYSRNDAVVRQALDLRTTTSYVTS